MLNWDLFSHPGAKEFARNTSNEENTRLAQNWKHFMNRENIYISFYEWYKKNHQIHLWDLAPQKSSPI